MTWLLIIVVLAAAFAPVAYMMPTKRDRALSDLRMLARREGLEVDVTRLPNLGAAAHELVSASGVAREATIDCVSYGLRRAKSEATAARYRLLRNVATEFPVVAALPWELDRKFKVATTPAPGPDYWSILEVVEGALPGDALGLAVTDEFVLCYWREKLPAEGPDSAAIVANLRQVLNKIAKYHEDYFTPVRTDERD